MVRVLFTQTFLSFHYPISLSTRRQHETRVEANNAVLAEQLENLRSPKVDYSKPHEPYKMMLNEDEFWDYFPIKMPECPYKERKPQEQEGKVREEKDEKSKD